MIVATVATGAAAAAADATTTTTTTTSTTAYATATAAVATGACTTCVLYGVGVCPSVCLGGDAWVETNGREWSGVEGWKSISARELSVVGLQECRSKLR